MPKDIRFAPLFEQIAFAFSQKENLSGAIHGLRRVHLGAVGRRPALFVSAKNDASIAAETTLEAAGFLDLERDPSVDSYRPQAIALPSKKGYFKYPDVLIKRTDGSYEVREFKPSYQGLSGSVKRDLALIAAQLHKACIPYRVTTAQELPGDAALASLLKLYARGNRHNLRSEALAAAISATLNGPRTATLDQRWKFLNDLGMPACIADYLVFHGALVADLRSTLLPSTTTLIP